MIYEEALDTLKGGYSIARKGWLGRVTLLSEYTIQLKVLLVDEEEKVIGATTTPIRITRSFLYINSDNTAVAGWVPSTADQLAEDWYAIDDSILVEFPSEVEDTVPGEDVIPERTH